MTKELSQKLFEKYPKIFRQKDLPMNQTCMCWGCECGDGWYNILDRLCNKIQEYIDSNPGMLQVEFSQVKEKFALLRIYVDGADDKIYDMISEAEEESGKICEVCGTKGKTYDNGWMKTLCHKCTKELKYES